jgi:anti-sigma regulatory factor (Ser/Thr protein kinase)
MAFLRKAAAVSWPAAAGTSGHDRVGDLRRRGSARREVSTSTVVLLPHAPSGVSQARHRLGADLRAHGVAEPAICDATLVLSELMSNAVRHARPLPGEQIRVAWALSNRTLELAVSDGGGPTEPRTGRPPSVSSLGGRGLGIVDHLSRCWGVRSDHLGTTVWAVLTARQGRAGPARPSRVLATS